MYELNHIKGNTYYINSPANIGLYIKDNQAYLIDSGNDKEAGRKILRILKDNNWELNTIINTHSNADHIGGNKFLQDRTNCKIVATEKETAFIKYPELEAAFLWGGFQYKDLNNKFLKAQPSDVTDIVTTGDNIDDLSIFALKGHFHDMIGVKTPDNVVFIADSIFSKYIVDKYSIFYLFDIEEHFNTLYFLENLDADIFVPSHADPTDNLSELIQINKDKINEIMEDIRNICEERKVVDDIIAEVSNKHGVKIDANQYVLVGSCLRSYLSYMYANEMLEIEYENNKMYWKSK